MEKKTDEYIRLATRPARRATPRQFVSLLESGERRSLPGLRAQLESWLQRPDDGLVGCIGGSTRVNNDDPVRLATRYTKVSCADALEKCAALLFEAVLVGFVAVGAAAITVAAAGARNAQRGVSVHQQREVRADIAAERAVQLQHRPAAQLTAAALVGFGRVGEAVTENDFALRERRQDQLLQMLCARGKHQRHLRFR